MSGAIFHYLDTLVQPVFPATKMSIIEIDGKLYHYQVESDQFNWTIKLYDLAGNILCSYNSSCSDGVFSEDGEMFVGIGNYGLIPITSSNGGYHDSESDYKEYSYINTARYSQFAALGTPDYYCGFSKTFSIIDPVKDTIVYEPKIDISNSNCFINESGNVFALCDTSGINYLQNFRSDSTVSIFISPDKTIGLSPDFSIVASVKGKLHSRILNPTDTLLLSPARKHTSEEEFQIPCASIVMAFSPDSKNIAVADTAGIIRVYSINNRTEILQFKTIASAPTVLEYTPDGNYILYGTSTGRVIVVRAKDGTFAFALDDIKNDSITKIKISRNMKYVVAIGANMTMANWHTDFSQVSVDEKPVIINPTNVSIAPNPAEDRIRVIVQTDVAGELVLSIYNFNGEKMFSANQFISNNEVVFESDCSDFMPGTYLYRIENREGIIASGKFTVTK
jgi:WD40 repeat protein